MGNYGEKYFLNRHNIGFLFLDYLSGEENFKYNKIVESDILNFSLLDKKILLAKPRVFMNNSGSSVIRLLNFFKCKKFMVISDDLDQEFGKIKMKEKGSSGGHNGIKDIIRLVETEIFPRIKIGIGRGDFSTSSWVLSNFEKDEISQIKEYVFSEVKDRLLSYLNNF